MKRGDCLPLIKGFGLMVVQNDPEDLMKEVERRKRIKRELDDDLVEELDDDTLGSQAGLEPAGLMEKRPLSAMPKPEYPPVVPTMTWGTLFSMGYVGFDQMTKC